MLPMKDFHGVKIALLWDGKVVTYLRDNKPGLTWAGLWDLPGGGRENNETPDECVIREVQEEFGFTLDPSKIVWRKTYPSMQLPDQNAVFMVARIDQSDIGNITFGGEGECWKLMTIDEYLKLSSAVGPLQNHFRDFLASGTPIKP